MSRSWILVLAVAAQIALVATSKPSIVGDGGEYLAQTINFASGHGPAIRGNALPDIQQRMSEIDPRRGQRIHRALVRGDGAGSDFVHFWFYALIVAPVFKAFDVAGAPPIYAFAAVNILLLAAAMWVVLPRIGPALCLLIFAGPIVWFIDKPHTEVFTFALLTITFAWLREKPWWSMVAAGAAATQNPPIAVVVAIVAATAAIADPAIVRHRPFQIGAAVGVFLAVLHPSYTYLRHETPSLLLASTRSGTPAFAEIAAVITDPSLGLVGNFPLFLFVVGASLVTVLGRAPRALRSPELLAAAVTVPLFLYSFARTTNVHHGGTPSFSRYVFWLVPLAVPLFAIAATHGRRLWKAVAGTAAVVSAAICIVAFRPSVPENSREPTWLATWLWTRAPAWHDPVPEVFVETHMRVDKLTAPVATAGCEKVLLAGRGGTAGMWPLPCYPQAVPAWCDAPGALCYANLEGSTYSFVRTPGRRRGAPTPVARGSVWPVAAEPFVRQIYDGRGWRRLGVNTDGLRTLTRARNVRVRTLGDDREFLLVLVPTRSRASLRFVPQSPVVHAALIDPVSGKTIDTPQFRGKPGDTWNVPIPHEFDVLLMTGLAERQ
jgi:hypothetical protein